MLCVSLSDKTTEECLQVLNGLKVAEEMVEIRVDLISGRGQHGGSVDGEGLKSIYAHPITKIVTCRDLKETGFTEERRSMLEVAIKTGTVQMVDIEIEAPEQYRQTLVDLAKANNVEVIISYHNYENTPSTEELNKLVNTCFEYGASIAKLATKSLSVRDSARLLSLYDDERNIVALGMGELGMITRVAAISLGARFSFAADTIEKATAPGQLTTGEMRTIFDTMARKK